MSEALLGAPGADYVTLRSGVKVARQHEVADGVIVDLDAVSRIVGVETIGASWEAATYAIMLAARIPGGTA